MKTSHAIQKKAKSNTPISSIAKKKNAVQAEKNSSNAPVKIIGKTVERPGFSSQTSSVIQPKPTEALDKITELWKSETQEKLRCRREKTVLDLVVPCLCRGIGSMPFVFCFGSFYLVCNLRRRGAAQFFLCF